MSTTKTYKEKLQLLLNTKTQFKNDIINAGGTIDNSTPFSSYPAIYKTLKGGAPDGTAVEVTTEADMDALLVSSNVGKFYKYTGETTDKYTKDAIYVIQDSSDPIVNEGSGGVVKIERIGGIQAVPADTYVGTVYFNTALSCDEVDNIISNSNIPFVPNGELSMYVLCCTGTIQSDVNSISVVIFDFSTYVGTTAYAISLLNDSEIVYYVSESLKDLTGGQYGWVQGAEINTAVINSTLVNLVEVGNTTVYVGTHNENLKQLINTIEEPYYKELSGTYVPIDLEINENTNIDLTTYMDNKQMPISLGVNVPIPEPVLQEKTVTPTKEAQTIVQCDAGYDGLSKVTVKRVGSSIDSNIKNTNIKKGVTILGVTGTYTGEGTSGGTISREYDKPIPSGNTNGFYIADPACWSVPDIDEESNLSLCNDLVDALTPSEDDDPSFLNALFVGATEEEVYSGAFMISGIFYVDYDTYYDIVDVDELLSFRRLFFVFNTSSNIVLAYIDLPYREYEVDFDEETGESVYEYGYDAIPLFQGDYKQIVKFWKNETSPDSPDQNTQIILNQYIRDVFFTQTTTYMELRDENGEVIDIPMGRCNTVLHDYGVVRCDKFIVK